MKEPSGVRWAEQLLRMAVKVYKLDDLFDRYRDSRSAPRIPARLILTVFLAGLWLRAGSLHEMERMVLNGDLAGILGPQAKVREDTLRRFLEDGDLPSLRAYLGSIVRRSRYNKVFPHGTLGGFVVAALDGNELFYTLRPTKKTKGWLVRKHSGRAGEKEYVQKAVAASYTGVPPRLCLGLERIRPGEDEVSAALRLIESLDQELGPTWFDVLELDALYPRAPFLNRVLRGNRHVVVKVKKQEMAIVRDADGLFEGRAPSTRLRDAFVLTQEEMARGARPSDRYDVEIWDEEGFTSWEGLKRPLRCLRVVETRHKREKGRWVTEPAQVYHVVTTLPRSLAGPERIWQLMHRRWDIENSLFNDLTQNWGLTHCYTRHPHAIETLCLLLAIARNLFLLFFYRRLGETTRRGQTWIGVCRSLWSGFSSPRLLERLGRPFWRRPSVPARPSLAPG